MRQLVGQIQELCDLYGFPPPPPPPPPRFPLPASSLSLRCSLHNLDSSSLDENYCNFLIEGKEKSYKMVEANKFLPAKKPRRERNREKLPINQNSAQIMEEEIWNRFPDDLFEAVIARLPVATLFRFRSVCRKWNAILNSNSFSQQCAEVPQAYPWFYTITHENIHNGAMYDPSTKKWHHASIPSLHRRIVLPVSSAGGLVCFLDLDHEKFFISNPLTRSFKELPPRSARDWSRIAVGMSLNGKSSCNGYKIMWLDCNGDHEVYDSVQDRWSRLGVLPPHIKLPLCLNYRSQALTINGSLYFMRSAPEGIVSYDMSSGVWKQLIIPSPPCLSDHTLAECGGRIMLVGLLTKNAVTCVCIWELQKMTLLWKEVDRMPNVWCLDFYGRHVRMTCLGNRGLLLLSLRSKQMNRLVSYDLSSKEWNKVPSCVLPHGKKRQWIACGTAFRPCPTAFA